MTDLEISKLYIKSLAKKYGNEAVYDAINERSYSYGSYGRDMDSPGPTSAFNGAKGFFRSIPSFMICALISPPLAGLMLLGALFHRINQKWHDHDSALAVMNPFTWAEYLATGNYIPKGMDKPFWNSGSNANPNDVKAAHGDSSAMAASAAMAASELNENVPSEEAGKLIYNYRWLCFDNGEIRKVKCYNDQQAATYAKVFLANPQKNGGKGARTNYENLNKLLRSKQEMNAYICEYDDGQIIYVIGESEATAKTVADDIIVKTANFYKKQSDDYEVPVLKYTTRTDWDKIQPMTRCANILKAKPAHKDYVPTHRSTDSENKYYWEFDKFKQYTLTTTGGLKDVLRFKIPAVYSPNNKQAINIAEKLFDETDTSLTLYIRSIYNASHDTEWYRVTSFDGDKYIIPTDKSSENPLNQVYLEADILHQQKMRALRNIMSSEEITKVVEYAQKHGMTGGDTTKWYKVTPLKSAADESERRLIKDLSFEKETNVNGHLDIERAKSSEQKFTIPFLKANSKPGL